MSIHPAQAANHAALLAQIDALTEAGQLRRLSGAFARFIATLGNSSPPLMLACVLLSELEGRGHSCLLLSELASDPRGMLGWTEEEWRALKASAGPLPKNASAWRALLYTSEQVWPVADLDFGQPLVLDQDRLYLRRYWRDESTVARAVRARAGEARPVDVGRVRHWLDILFPHAPREGGPDWQKIACAVALRANLGIITGGPGTGKTYTVARLLALLFATAGGKRELAPGAEFEAGAAGGLRIALAAPTGKAAARLKQSIDHALEELAEKVPELDLPGLAARMGAARTLHSLLGARPDTRQFVHNKGNPLDVDVLIVDEASMVHLEMMASLLDALPDHARLILLGDKDQLASVEAGAVLGDLCQDAQSGGYSASTAAYILAASGQAIPEGFLRDAGPLAQQTVMLRQSRRFGGPIGQLALAVNAGDAAAARAALGGDSGGQLAWISPAQPSDALQLALAGREGAGGGYERYLRLIRAGHDAGTHEGGHEGGHEQWVMRVLAAFESFRILCAVRVGEWGVAGLNEAIEQRLEAAGLLRRRGEWYEGRPVMVTRNDYGTGVFNGDIGLTLPDPARPGSLRVYFSEGQAVRSVLATRLRQVETAFAMTVHKSQGSEFSHTVMALPKESSAVLARELVYTGITRAKHHFTLLTPVADVLDDAIAERTQRASGLRTLIAGN
ncbi:exodeoxyribonuclease V subunit alpha [Pseudoduganella namucuonensis]|uniref:RecBCD enzyme subunit RecD n=1 Tax=Pseudoduganella namucuonensis TaxID=1035707 RepID=A0A1I7HVM7_9BURK|nr:exodeoxyribonuclease V subunit alpha [Pseudoduganella namucuonensis]SFU64717.1 DNA helicase/exodeoxyribonuclease V, alpha subunit [Pseudoduganella namucuonensis]